ncbi:CTP:molybdopterin cytidylyltransferase MocA [Microbacterium paludicola]|uniref:CTP:molybdopterin cytidylyltransferase MocA n=1 Tax=Microbacterium paludicola TaxID=300019 RepID=A0ABU1I4P3_9MICO|nr:NTP transferase domain-containing protein [Microbacterium paludicola]MDR6168123.1 CTP:molybdopterin cytidylyltransferase MocA [Microbacterium paludicola]
MTDDVAPRRTPPVGIVLAAGAGTRYGMPKALAVAPGGRAWLDGVVAALAAAGCEPILVMLGAAPEAPVPAGARARVVEDWREGLSATVRAALAAASGTDAAVAVIVPVDVPELPARAVARLLTAAAGDARARHRAVFGGRPGHPVVLGRAHWDAAACAVSGDEGAGAYLRRIGAVGVECSDLWHGRDIDHPPDDGRAPDGRAPGA